jgi:UDP-glucose 4-epimerase
MLSKWLFLYNDIYNCVYVIFIFSLHNLYMNNILVTGGLGFIGSHTVVELLNYNYSVIIIDNLNTSTLETLDKIKTLNNGDITFYKGDILDQQLLNNIFIKHNIYAVIHFAGLKAVSESVKDPIKYYENNVGGTVSLLKAMDKHNVKNLIFSSSATVYGNNKAPFTEESKTGINITNPYGKSKYLIEEILRDLPEWNIFSLRYFNPIGCHPSGIIGENPSGIPNNLMPYLMNVVSKKYPFLSVYGDNYNTIDGTGVRDYIHVIDLALAHVKALTKFKTGFTPLNIGIGKGTSVLELIHIFENVNNVKVPYKICPRREGDIDISICDPVKANSILEWRAVFTVEDMCRDSWNFVKPL